MTESWHSWCGRLWDVVRSRLLGRVVPHDQVVALLESVTSSFEEATGDHGGWWSAGAWRDGFAAGPKLQQRVNRLADRLRNGPDHRPDWRYITRSDVFASDTTLDLFLAALAWGFGTTGYGWRRTLAIFAEADDDAVTKAIKELKRSFAEHGAEGVWTAFSPGGKAKLTGLGAAFASKVAYFTCYDRPGGTGPLIADRNAAWAFWALEGSWDIRASAGLYGRYVATASAWAAESGWQSDDVERALFVLGPYTRKIYKDCQPL